MRPVGLANDGFRLHREATRASMEPQLCGACGQPLSVSEMSSRQEPRHLFCPMPPTAASAESGVVSLPVVVLTLLIVVPVTVLTLAVAALALVYWLSPGLFPMFGP